MGDYGRPLNPHNPQRITGGSSSGSGAALAAGEVDVSFGGDQGGSIRLPAAYCGVVGLKPTFGLVSHFAVGFAAEPSVDHVGPMARTVPDVAAALQAVAGYDGYDPRQHRGIPDNIDALSDLDGGVRGLRIGILEEGFAEPIEPEVSAGVLAAVSTLEKLGAEVSRISVPQHAQIDSVYAALVLEGARAIHDTGFFGIGAKTYYPASVITAIDRMWRAHGDMLPPRTKLAHLVAELSAAITTAACMPRRTTCGRPMSARSTVRWRRSTCWRCRRCATSHHRLRKNLATRPRRSWPVCAATGCCCRWPTTPSRRTTPAIRRSRCHAAR